MRIAKILSERRKAKILNNLEFFWAIYDRYSKLLDYITWKNSTPESFKDNRQKASLYYAEASQGFKYNSGSLKSFIGQNIKNGFINEHIKKNRIKRGEKITMPLNNITTEENNNPEELIPSNMPSQEHSFLFNESIKNLSMEAQTTIYFALNTSNKVWEEIEKNGHQKQSLNLMDYLYGQNSYNHQHCKNLLDEIKSVL